MEIVVIDLQLRDTDCTLCGARHSLAQGLPMYEGEVVADDFEGDWGGFPVCKKCFVKHRPTKAKPTVR